MRDRGGHVVFGALGRFSLAGISSLEHHSCRLDFYLFFLRVFCELCVFFKLIKPANNKKMTKNLPGTTIIQNNSLVHLAPSPGLAAI
jgi:hypothetical protein